MDGPEKFKLTELPPREKFYSSLTEETVSEEDYARAQLVWTEFHISNMQEYHDLYLSLDILLLSLKTFERWVWNIMVLMPFTTTPAWITCLKKNKQSLTLLMSPEHLLFFENSIRGEISVVSHRHAKANNPIVPVYNPDDVN